MTQVQIRELEHVRNLGIEFEPIEITKYQVLQLVSIKLQLHQQTCPVQN